MSCYLTSVMRADDAIVDPEAPQTVVSSLSSRIALETLFSCFPRHPRADSLMLKHLATTVACSIVEWSTRKYSKSHREVVVSQQQSLRLRAHPFLLDRKTSLLSSFLFAYKHAIARDCSDLDIMSLPSLSILRLIISRSWQIDSAYPDRY
jgi:hypothetical protein